MFSGSVEVQIEVLNYLFVSGAPLFRLIQVVQSLFILLGCQGNDRLFSVESLRTFKRTWPDWNLRYVNVLEYDSMTLFRIELVSYLDGLFPLKEKCHGRI